MPHDTDDLADGGVLARTAGHHDGGRGADRLDTPMTDADEWADWLGDSPQRREANRQTNERATGEGLCHPDGSDTGDAQ